MTKEIKLGKLESGNDYTVDLENLGNVWVFGRTGSGKSVFVRNIAYQLADLGSDFIVFDKENEYKSFKDKYNDQFIDYLKVSNLDKWLIEFIDLINYEYHRRDELLNSDEELDDLTIVFDEYDLFRFRAIEQWVDFDEIMKVWLSNASRYNIRFLIITQNTIESVKNIKELITNKYISTNNNDFEFSDIYDQLVFKPEFVR